jgi:hypothetical protein
MKLNKINQITGYQSNRMYIAPLPSQHSHLSEYIGIQEKGGKNQLEAGTIKNDNK